MQRRDVPETHNDAAQGLSTPLSWPATTDGIDPLEPKFIPLTVSNVPIATAGPLNGVRYDATGAAHNTHEFTRVGSILEKTHTEKRKGRNPPLRKMQFREACGKYENGTM